MSDEYKKSNEQNSDKPILGSLCIKGIIVLIAFSLFGIIKHPEKSIKTLFQKSSKIAVKNSDEIDNIFSIIPRGGVRVLGGHTIEEANIPERKPSTNIINKSTKNKTKSTLRNNMILEGFYSSFDKSVEPGFFIIELMKMPEDGRLDYIKSLYSYILSDNIPMKSIDEMSENYLTEFNEMLKNKDELYYVHFNKISSLEHHKSN